MKKSYWIDAQHRKTTESHPVYSTQTGFDAKYLRRHPIDMATSKIHRIIAQWEDYRRWSPEKKQANRDNLSKLLIGFPYDVRKLLDRFGHPRQSSCSFPNVSDLNLSISANEHEYLEATYSIHEPIHESFARTSTRCTCFLYDPLELIEQSKDFTEFMDLVWFNQGGKENPENETLLREVVLKFFDLPDFRESAAFALPSDFLQGKKKIAPQTFLCNPCISSAEIPFGITEIGKLAFAGCCNLSILSLPASIRRIGDAAFAYCRSLKKIIVPEGVTEIGDSTFKRCTSLETIILPKSLRLIGNNAFQGCTQLKQIILPENLESIGEEAFCCCLNLESITIPNAVRSIEYGTFCNCRKLKSVLLPHGITSIGKKSFSTCSILHSINIPNTVCSIGTRAFAHCLKLRLASLPDSIKTLGEGAFYSCQSLMLSTLPKDILVINEHTFSDCREIESLRLPDHLEFIGSKAFQYCSNLKSITLPDSVREIGESAFFCCRELISINIPDKVTALSADTFNSCHHLRHIVGAIEKIPEHLKTDALIGFAQNEQMYPQHIQESYYTYLTENVEQAFDLAIKYPQMIFLLCRQKLIDTRHFDVLLNIAVQMKNIELTALLLEYKSSHLTSEAVPGSDLSLD